MQRVRVGLLLWTEVGPLRAYSSSITNNFLWPESSSSTLKLVLWPPPSDSESEYNNIPDAEPSRCFGGEPTHGESGVGAVFLCALGSPHRQLRSSCWYHWAQSQSQSQSQSQAQKMDNQQKSPKHYASLVGCNSRERLGFVHSLMLGTVEVEIKQQISSAGLLIGGSAWLSTNRTQRKWKKNYNRQERSNEHNRGVPANT